MKDHYVEEEDICNTSSLSIFHNKIIGQHIPVILTSTGCDATENVNGLHLYLTIYKM